MAGSRTRKPPRKSRTVAPAPSLEEVLAPSTVQPTSPTPDLQTTTLSDDAALKALDAVFVSLDLGIVLFDADRRITFASEVTRRALPAGDNLAQVLSAAAFDLGSPDWDSVLSDVLESRQPRRFDALAAPAPNGAANGPRYFKLIIAPLNQGNHAGRAGLLVIEDITTHISIEQRLAVSERLAALGQLAARVAHELNNPLDGILRYINLSRRVAEDAAQPRLIEYLDQARTGLMRMARIVRSLLEYARGGYGGPHGATAAAMIEEALRTFEKQAAAAGVSVVCSFEDEEAAAPYSASMYQVFCNVVKNAIDAMPGGGTLTVRTRRAAGELVITFEDSGVGLPENHERIFEPFYTTKPAGQGTGLGLAVCRELVEKCGGRIEAARRGDVGTVITVRLPRRTEDGASRGTGL